MVLADGGNAIEAMVAMAATITVVYPHMNHLGGDGVWLLREPSGRLRALIAAGRAGANARRELYREHESILARGPFATLTVPGAVAGWMLALEAARAHGGRVPLADLLADATRHATDGYAVTRSQARLTAEKLAELENVPGFAQTFLVDGKPPAAGAVLKQPVLAATLDHLCRAGLDDFYRGDIGREIASDLDRLGSPVTRGDLERAQATLAEPLSVALQSGTAFNTPPPTQGLASLMVLALFERLGVKAAEGFDHIHGLIEATKRAFYVRDGVVTDPERMARSVDRYLEAQFLDAQARAIDRRKAAPWPATSARRGDGDTVWMGSDRCVGAGRFLLQSLYWEFGSGVVLPATGVLMAEPGRELFARSRRLECAGARTAAVPHPQPCARRARRRSHPRLRRHGRRRPAADAGSGLHAPCSFPPADRARHRCRALAARPYLGGGARQSSPGSALRWQSARPPGRGRPRCRGVAAAL